MKVQANPLICIIRTGICEMPSEKENGRVAVYVQSTKIFVPNPGGDFPEQQHGFPYLSGAGGLVIKDIIMLVAGLMCASYSVKLILTKN